VLAKAAIEGQAQAFACFGIKSAAIMDHVSRAFIGEAPQIFTEGAKAFTRGGVMSPGQVFWPKHWLGRIGTLATVPMLPGMIKRDPQEGTLSRVLGGVGEAAGGLYGATAGGLLGMPVGGAAGRRLGVGLGHLLGSKPNDQSLVY
jgi:hypothetical protein